MKNTTPETATEALEAAMFELEAFAHAAALAAAELEGGATETATMSRERLYVLVTRTSERASAALTEFLRATRSRSKRRSGRSKS